MDINKQAFYELVEDKTIAYDGLMFPENTGIDDKAFKDRVQEIKDSMNKSLKPQYLKDRENKYPFIAEQFDMLYRDIAAGKFGDAAKTGELFVAIKAAKDTYPKP